MKTEPWLEAELEQTNCPICNATNHNILYQNQPDITFNSTSGVWNMYLCTQCHATFLNPRPTRESIHKAYQSYYTHIERHDWIKRFPPIAQNLLIQLKNGFYASRYGYYLKPSSLIGAWLIPLIPWLEYRFELDIRQIGRPPKNGRLLDVGCGNGDYLGTMQQLGWQVLGIEPDPKAAAFGQTKGLEIQVGTLETIQLEPESFDVITLSHVIEHVHDPIQTLHKVLRLLKPGGRVWIATPNLDSFGHKKYRNAWRGLEIPRHLVMFSTRHLQQCLVEVGFHCPPISRQALVATNLFRISNSLALGYGIEKTPKLKLSDLLQAIYADVYCIFSPWHSEYASIIGRKP